jgi:hypothetical protein
MNYVAQRDVAERHKSTLNALQKSKNAESFGTILAIQPLIAFPSQGQEIDCKTQSNSR